MQTALLSALVILLNVMFSHGQKGQILKDQTLKSSVINQPVQYNIYLPPNYDENKSYPVIYYLHGFGGDHHSSNGFMEKMDPEILNRKKWFIQVCDQDYHSLANARLYTVFHKRNIDHEFRVPDGKHAGRCVQSGMNEAIEFLKKNIIKPETCH
jgi:enterochelin esterase-like enzyme